MLRTPLVLAKVHWIASLSICTHASQALLSMYFELYQPLLENLFNQTLEHPDLLSSPAALCSTLDLPLTWRQVKRIMTSAAIMVLAKLYGELAARETARYLAMAELLLECQRLRWKRKLDGALGLLADVGRLENLDVDRERQILLPRSTGRSLARSNGEASKPGAFRK